MPRSRRAPIEIASGPRYTFAADEPLRVKNAKLADPQVIGAALARIADAHNGHLTPVATVDAARDPTHPLNAFFEWDDRVAADAFREEQARHLIRLIRVVDDERDEPPRAFLSVRDAQEGISYRSVGDVANSLALQLSVLTAAERDLAAFQRRYRELRDICSGVADAEARVRQRRERLAATAEAQPQ